MSNILRETQSGQGEASKATGSACKLFSHNREASILRGLRFCNKITINEPLIWLSRTKRHNQTKTASFRNRNGYINLMAHEPVLNRSDYAAAAA